MRHLIVFAHPNAKSFCQKICENLIELSTGLGNKVVVRDLYNMNFNPVLSPSDFASIQKSKTPEDIQTEQDHISDSDFISLIFPLWWTGYPAILKGWIDRVLLNGFAYKYTTKSGAVPLLTGKKIQILTTMGQSVEEYEANGLMDAMAMTMGDNVWSFCGCDDAGMVVLGDIPGMSDQERNDVLSEIEETLVLALSDHNLKPTKQVSSKKPAAKKPAKKKSIAKKKAVKKPSSKKTTKKSVKK